MAGFDGFKPEVIDFFWELKLNNYKAWMENNRERYRACLKEPFDSFAYELQQAVMRETGERIEYAISRINRDIRFSKDKSPYRACRWVVFKEPAVSGTEWRVRPCFYFEISGEGYTHGLGIYSASPNYMKQYRKKIEADPHAFVRMIKKLSKSEMKLAGESYKKPIGQELPENIREWYMKREVLFVAERELDDIVFSKELPEILAKEWKKCMPLYHFLREIHEE